MRCHHSAVLSCTVSCACDSNMHTADDLALKQAMVKFCTHLELASAFVQKVGSCGIVKTRPYMIQT